MIYFKAATQSFDNSGQFLRRLQGSVLLSPVFISLALFGFLITSGQIAEILIYVVEPQNARCSIHLIGGFAAMTLLALAVFYGYLSGCVILRKAGIGYGSSLFYKASVELQRDRQIVWWRNILAFLCAAIPLFAIGRVFFLASEQVALRTERRTDGSLIPPLEPDAASWLSRQLCATSAPDLAAHLSYLGWIWLVASSIAVVAILITAHLNLHLSKSSLQLTRRMTRTRSGWGISLLAIATLVAPIPLMLWAPQTHEELYLWLGPLATIGLVLMATAWLLFFIAEQSKRRGVPFFLIMFILVFGLGLWKWVSTATDKVGAASNFAASNSAGRFAPARIRAADGEAAPSEFSSKFMEWIGARQEQSNDGKPFPVYIVAAPGGGIYAASFITSFMARMEAECPGFSEHVFAISAVSGGSIGSTLINAAMAAPLRNAPTECPVQKISGEPQIDPNGQDRIQRLKKVVARDHLSPTIATTVPDIIIKLLQIGAYELQELAYKFGGSEGPAPKAPQMNGGRAEALELSFKNAWRQVLPRPKDAKCKVNCNPLNAYFQAHWEPKINAAPALILNTTWAETGARIAFSPFSLRNVGDDTLLAIADLEKPQLTFNPLLEPRSEVQPIEHASLIEAAVVSARFPAVLPAKVINTGKLWWNFVDGGYADASGTTTALEIYKAIDQLRDKPDIDLKLLIITESGGNIGFDTGTQSQSGAGLVHAISPITTLLTIREQISRRAVARALKELGETANSKRRCWKIKRVVLDPKELNLPLGWLLARHTVDSIDRKMALNNKVAIDAIKANLTGKGPCSEEPPWQE